MSSEPDFTVDNQLSYKLDEMYVLLKAWEV